MKRDCRQFHCLHGVKPCCGQIIEPARHEIIVAGAAKSERWAPRDSPWARRSVTIDGGIVIVPFPAVVLVP
jgi:hypothetical protein